MNGSAAKWASDPDAHFKGGKTPVSDIQNEGSVGLNAEWMVCRKIKFFGPIGC